MAVWWCAEAGCSPKWRFNYRNSILSTMAEVDHPQFSEYRQSVKEYYNRMNRLILDNIGYSYQAATLIHYKEDPYRETNEFVAKKMGIKSGSCLLDAGCGTCGPAIDIVNFTETTRISAVTLSLEQAKIGHRLVQEKGLSDHIQVYVCDFHELPFPDNTFDGIYFLESSGYSYSLERLYSEVYRVLRPGGFVYDKGVFKHNRELTEIEAEALAIFDRIYVFKTQTMEHHVSALMQQRFRVEFANDMSHVFNQSLITKAKIQHDENGQPIIADGKPLRTEFGKYHVNRLGRHVPVYFGDIKAVKSPVV